MKYNKYSDKNFINKYVFLWSFGFVNNIGYSEGLYRTINEMAFSSLPGDGKYLILDVGCGVGRTAVDLGKFFKNSTVEAIDKAPLMCYFAKKIIKSDKKLAANFGYLGFGKLSVSGFDVKNVSIRNITIENYYYLNKNKKFNLITSVNLIDRISNIDSFFKIIFKLLDSGGVFIFSTPLNFSDENNRLKFGLVESIKNKLIRLGFNIETCFDGLIYKEILDNRGSTEEYPTMVMKLIKP